MHYVLPFSRQLSFYFNFMVVSHDGRNGEKATHAFTRRHLDSTAPRRVMALSWKGADTGHCQMVTCLKLNVYHVNY